MQLRSTLGLVVGVVMGTAMLARGQSDDPFDESPYLQMYQILPRAYKMSPAQREQFRALLDRLTDRYHQYLAERQEQVDRLRQRYSELMELRRAGGEVPIARLRQLQRECSAIIRLSPLGPKNVMAEIEKFLPAEQVRAARGLPPLSRRTGQAATRPSRRPPQAATRPLVVATTRPARWAGQRAPAAGRPRSRLSFKPPQAWRRYVEGFIARNRLDPRRAQSARRILQDLLQQARRHRQHHRQEYESVKNIGDVAVRRELLDRLEAPIGRLFDRLCAELKALKGISAAPTSRPANAGP
ncbi:MAG: hypothetical protein ACE5K7_04165 [Phycisphaerae bacterium]